MWRAFWLLYERTYTLNVSVALGLFLLQIVHLIWLFGEVVWAKLFGIPLFTLEGFWKFLIVFVDYTEIPAIISVSLVYIHDLQGRWSIRNALYLGFLNIQWLHLFWISDEFIITSFTGSASVLFPLWLAWIAVLIDYLEVPILFDLSKRFGKAARQGRLEQFLRESRKLG